MIAKKHNVANIELLRTKHKNDRLFLYIGTFFIIAVGCSIAFLLFRFFLIKLEG
jgi:hypothetical protein